LIVDTTEQARITALVGDWGFSGYSAGLGGNVLGVVVEREDGDDVLVTSSTRLGYRWAVGYDGDTDCPVHDVRTIDELRRAVGRYVAGTVGPAVPLPTDETSSVPRVVSVTVDGDGEPIGLWVDPSRVSVVELVRIGLSELELLALAADILAACGSTGEGVVDG
jgi:hypothetical protein